MSLQGQWLPDRPCGPASAGIVRRRRASERSLNPSKAGEEGSSFVMPRSTDPLRWVPQPAGCLGCPASEVPSSPFHEGEVAFAWVLCPTPGSESCSRCCGIRAGEKQRLRASSASCFPLSSSGQCIPSQRNALRSFLPVLAAGIPSGEHAAFTTCSRNDLALAGPGVGAQTLPCAESRLIRLPAIQLCPIWAFSAFLFPLYFLEQRFPAVPVCQGKR